MVYDIGGCVVNRKGEIKNHLSAIVLENHTKDLFYTKDESKSNHWSYANMKLKTAEYHRMIEDGRCTLSSIAAINRWLDRVLSAYPGIELTAFNLSFDLRVCADSGIRLEQFPNRFDMWALAVGNICKTPGYRRFCLENHFFTNPTEKRNCSIKTSAECVYRYIMNDPEFVEDHTAYSDSLIEAQILKFILSKNSYDKAIAKSTPYAWRDFQLNKHFRIK